MDRAPIGRCRRGVSADVWLSTVKPSVFVGLTSAWYRTSLKLPGETLEMGVNMEILLT
ncbi:MAG: hypothetical protein ACE5PV_14925 [Candidatus Poribacteria bacterium]